MKSTVNGSIISQLLDLLKSVSNNLSKSINSLLDAGAEYENAHKDKEGNVVFTITVYTGEGDNKKKHQFKVKVIKLEDNKVELHFKHPNGTVITKTVKDNKQDYDRAFQSVAVEWYGTDALDDVVDQNGRPFYKTKQLDVTLQRVTGSTCEDKINLVAVNCSYDPDEALSDLDSVLDDADFVSYLTDEEKSFHITDMGDDNLYVQVCDNFEPDVAAQLTTILQKAYRLIADATYFQWAVQGSYAQELATLCDTIKYDVQYQIDSFVQYITVNHMMEAPHPVDLLFGADTSARSEHVDKNWAFSHLIDDVSMYIQAMNLYCCNMPDPLHQACSEYAFRLTNSILSPMMRYMN